MPSRRTVLKGVGLGVLAAVAVRTFAYPEVRVDGGVGTLHPASEQYLAPDALPADESLGARLLDGPDGDLVGPAATDTVRSALTDEEWFRDPGDEPATHRLVVQYRSTPERPLQLVLRDVAWDDVWTLAFHAGLSDWGSIADIEDEERRERLRSADRLAYTSVWSVRAPVGPLPDPHVSVLTSMER